MFLLLACNAEPRPEAPPAPLPHPDEDHSGYVPAEEYRRYDALDLQGRLAADLGGLAELLPVQPGQAVAEVGCGPGPYLLALADAVGPSGLVYEVDVDPNAIAFVERRLARAGAVYGRSLPQVRSRLSRFDDVGLPPASVDWILLHQVHNYVNLPAPGPHPSARARYEAENLALSRSFHAALRPGGAMLVVEMPRSMNPGASYGADEVEAFVQATGLFATSARADPVLGGAWALRFTRLP